MNSAASTSAIVPAPTTDAAVDGKLNSLDQANAGYYAQPVTAAPAMTDIAAVFELGSDFSPLFGQHAATTASAVSAVWELPVTSVSTNFDFFAQQATTSSSGFAQSTLPFDFGQPTASNTPTTIGQPTTTFSLFGQPAASASGVRHSTAGRLSMFGQLAQASSRFVTPASGNTRIGFGIEPSASSGRSAFGQLSAG